MADISMVATRRDDKNIPMNATNVSIDIPYRMYPNVHIDTFAQCNARCIFCVYPRLTRPHGKMSMDLFHKVVDEIGGWGVPIEITPVHYGEYFLNPDWLHIIQYIQDRAPLTSISISTNGSVLDDRKIDELVKTTHVGWINFSVYAWYADSYERLIGLPANTLDKIKHAVVRLRTERPDIRIAVGATNDEQFISRDEFKLLFDTWGPLLAPHEMTRNHQHGFLNYRKSLKPCTQPYDATTVLYDGRVCACCFDANGEEILGDVNINTILDIWNGGKMMEFRAKHMVARHSVKMCRSCTEW